MVNNEAHKSRGVFECDIRLKNRHNSGKNAFTSDDFFCHLLLLLPFSCHIYNVIFLTFLEKGRFLLNRRAPDVILNIWCLTMGKFFLINIYMKEAISNLNK